MAWELSYRLIPLSDISQSCGTRALNVPNICSPLQTLKTSTVTVGSPRLHRQNLHLMQTSSSISAGLQTLCYAVTWWFSFIIHLSFLFFSFLKSHLSVSDGQSSYSFFNSHPTLRMFASFWIRDARGHQRTETVNAKRRAVGFRNSCHTWRRLNI